jgi:hypothetical protein
MLRQLAVNPNISGDLNVPVVVEMTQNLMYRRFQKYKLTLEQKCT